MGPKWIPVARQMRYSANSNNFHQQQPFTFDLISSHYTRSTAAFIFQSYISIDPKTIIQIFIPHIVGKDQLGYRGIP